MSDTVCLDCADSAARPPPPLWGRVGEGGPAPTWAMDSALDPEKLAPRAPLRGAPPLPTLPRKGGGGAAPLRCRKGRGGEGFDARLPQEFAA